MTLLAALGAAPRAAVAAEFYVDPATGAAGNDGSAALPWSTLEQVIADGKFGGTIKAGDTVWLRDGYHGEAVLRLGTYAPPITIAAAAGASPRLRRVAFQQTHGWALVGVEISPSFAATYTKATLVTVDGSSSDVEVRGCRLFSVADAGGWSADDWMNVASNGVQVSGDHVTVRDCLVQNVRFGISVSGAHALIDSNQIVNFSADGLRGLGDYGVFQYNLVKNIYVSSADGDDNHDDGFQSWSVGDGGVGTGEVVGVELRGNFFLGTDDPARPFQATMQGIGCFDGYFTDWVVENNVVVTDHWHGISFYGMRGGRIVNNTVIDLNTTSPGPPWIMVTAHKDGTPSENVVVRNNLTTDLDVSGTNVVSDHNLEITMADLATHFVDPAAHDLHLLPTSPAVNAGSADLAPPVDRDGVARPQGAAVDLGAYEWHAALPQSDAGPALDAGGDAPSAADATTPDDGGAFDGGALDAAADVGADSDAAAATDAGAPGTDGGAHDPGLEGRCGCRAGTTVGARPAAWGLLLFLGALRRGRRRGGAAPRPQGAGRSTRV